MGTEVPCHTGDRGATSQGQRYHITGTEVPCHVGTDIHVMWGQRYHITGTEAPRHMGTEAPRHGDRGATSRGQRSHVTWGQRCHVTRGQRRHVTGTVQPRTDSRAVNPGLSSPQGCCLLLSYDQIDLSTPGPTPLIYSPFRYFCHFKNVIYLES